MGNRAGRARAESAIQVIQLRLLRASEMFELPQTDLFSEYRNFLTGVDFCLSEMRGRRIFRPVRLEIYLPPEEIDDGLAQRMRRTLGRYCDHRIRYNRREASSQRFGGISAARIGVPICLVGLLLTLLSSDVLPDGSVRDVLAEQFGWVLVWIGLWYPLDQLIFYPLTYGRESRVLRILSEADIVISAYQPTATS
jgi:hypothetical protein